MGDHTSVLEEEEVYKFCGREGLKRTEYNSIFQVKSYLYSHSYFSDFIEETLIKNLEN